MLTNETKDRKNVCLRALACLAQCVQQASSDRLFFFLFVRWRRNGGWRGVCSTQFLSPSLSASKSMGMFCVGNFSHINNYIFLHLHEHMRQKTYKTQINHQGSKIQKMEKMIHVQENQIKPWKKVCVMCTL